MSTLCEPPPPSPKKIYCQIQASFISFRDQRLTHFEPMVVSKKHVVLTIVHVNEKHSTSFNKTTGDSLNTLVKKVICLPSQGQPPPPPP